MIGTTALLRLTPVFTLLLFGASFGIGCMQAYAPRHGSVRTEDVSHVVYNEPWLKDFVYLRNISVERLPGDLLQVTAQLHSAEAHTSRQVHVRTEFYTPPMKDDGVVVDTTDWTPFILEPRKRVQYQVNSLVPADDFRIYVYYGKDLGKG